MLAWFRYHWLVRRRARRLLRDHVEALPAPPEPDTVIDLEPDTVIDLADDDREDAGARRS